MRRDSLPPPPKKEWDSAKPGGRQENMQVSREKSVPAEDTASAEALRQELSWPGQEQQAG